MKVFNNSGHIFVRVGNKVHYVSRGDIWQTFSKDEKTRKLTKVTSVQGGRRAVCTQRR